MNRIVHISDLHFGRQVPDIVAHLLLRIDEYEPDLIVITGDITQRATNRQYRLAQTFLKQLDHPYLVVPGNHDISIHRLFRRFHHPWNRWQKMICSDLEPVFQTNQLFVGMINTVRLTGYRLNWSRGRVNKTQTDRLFKRMADVPKTAVRIIAAHHPFWLPREEEHRHLVAGARDALPVFQAAGVDLILGGHIHTGFTQVEEGMIICHAGTTTSDRVKGSKTNSFNLISGDKNRLDIRRIQWDGTGFFSGAVKRFKRTAAGWAGK